MPHLGAFLPPRFYDPTTGQFLSRDPANALTRSPYGYVNGNPLNLTDPSGMWSVDLPGGWCVGNDDDCENPNNGHPTAVSQPIVNAAGGALRVNPITGNRWMVDSLNNFEARYGVDQCSGAYQAGQAAMIIGGLFAMEGEGEGPNFTDPSQSPGPGWEWRGSGEPGSSQGSWYNPGTDESLHPDLGHEDPIGPHYDYKGPDGQTYRVHPDGHVEPK